MKKIILYSLTTFVILSIVSFLQIYRNLNNYEISNYKQELKQINFIVNDTHILSNALFDNVINTQAVIDIFKEAYISSDEKRIDIRKNLFDLLSDNYHNFKKYGIQQLHFHLPNNDSFLRFHKPLKFGDNLTNVRASVKFVNENKIPIIGFEEGRIFNGYRFVYPLFDQDKRYIGSVEISSSLLNFKRLFEKSNNTDIDYVLNKKIVEGKVFKDELNNYQKYILSDQFLIQSSIANYDVNSLYKSEKLYLFKKLSEDKSFLSKMDNYESFYNIYFHNFKVYSINLIPLVNDFTKEKVGYRVMFSQSDYFDYIIDSYIIIILIILVLSVLIGYIVYKKEIEKKKTVNLAMHDQLTNIYNRHYFTTNINEKFKLMNKHNNELSLIMFDIDHFKVINDTYGHKIGDESLIYLTQLIQNNIRVKDVFCRWGGEEFMILSQKPFDKSIIMAEFLRKTIDTKTKENVDIPHFTCSFGVLSLENVKDVNEAIEKVDKLLYKSKKEGRNKVSS